MQKVTFIFFLVILTAGCSVIRTGGNRVRGLSKETLALGLLESINKQNITKNNFFIQKAEILFSGKKGTDRFLASIKFENPDKYLISIKSKAGIEAARVFISEDTILINDRINRKIYYGSALYLKENYGITAAGLAILFGDYIDDNLYDSKEAKCVDGKLRINGIVKGTLVKYVIDCKKRKSILVILENSMNKRGIEIQFNDFLKNKNVLTAGMIEIEDFQRMATIEIKIKKIESPWNGSIEFVPGNKYEIIQLL